MDSRMATFYFEIACIQYLTSFYCFYLGIIFSVLTFQMRININRVHWNREIAKIWNFKKKMKSAAECATNRVVFMLDFFAERKKELKSNYIVMLPLTKILLLYFFSAAINRRNSILTIPKAFTVCGKIFVWNERLHFFTKTISWF